MVGGGRIYDMLCRPPGLYLDFRGKNGEKLLMIVNSFIISSSDPVLPMVTAYADISMVRARQKKVHAALHLLGHCPEVQDCTIRQIIRVAFRVIPDPRYIMSAIGSLIFCTDCGNLLRESTGDANAILHCTVCGARNKGKWSNLGLEKVAYNYIPISKTNILDFPRHHP